MVKKRGIVWNYYTKKVDGSQVIVFCKFCDQSYIQNATRMERHMERCPKCPEDIRQQFIQAAHSKKHKASVLEMSKDWSKPNSVPTKQDSSMVHEVELGNLDDWSCASDAMQQNLNLMVENNDIDGSTVNRNWDAGRDGMESVTGKFEYIRLTI